MEGHIPIANTKGHLAQWVKHVTLDPRVISLSPTLHVKFTLKKKKRFGYVDYVLIKLKNKD